MTETIREQAAHLLRVVDGKITPQCAHIAHSEKTGTALMLIGPGMDSDDVLNLVKHHFARIHANASEA